MKLNSLVRTCLSLFAACALASGAHGYETATVDGVEWTYVVKDGKASVGGGSSSQTAVAKTTTGDLVIPTMLGGCPVTEIGAYAFYYCKSLTAVAIPPSVTSIGDHAFYFCSGLTSVTIPEGVNSIGEYAFYDCRGLTSVTIPEGVTNISDRAFDTCDSLTSVTIPESVTSIGAYAFRYCRSLTSVAIPEGVTKIGQAAFFDCEGLTSVTIPTSVTEIGRGAFADCDKAKAISVADGSTSFCSSDGILYDKSMSTLIQCPGGKSGSVMIPESVTVVGEEAFYGCSMLASVAIPEGVTEIGYYTFARCSKMTSATIPSSVTSIGQDAFYSCSSLTSVTIPEGVTNIARWAFHSCSSLTSVTIPEGVKNIAEYAFCCCSSLTSVTISEGVTSISDWAFDSCVSLASVTIPSSVTSIGERAFYACRGLTFVAIPEGVSKIGNIAFIGCSGLTSVTIPSSVTVIGVGAFADCDKAKAISVADGNASFCSSDGILYNKSMSTLVQCPGGKSGSVMIPESVTVIGGYAFYGCDGLTSVTIPSSVTDIGAFAFSSCNRLKTVYVEKGDELRVKGLIESSGYDASGLTFAEIVDQDGSYTETVDGVEWTYVVKGGKASVGGGTSGQTAVPQSTTGDLTIPTMLGGCPVTGIGNYAFCYCTGLAKVMIPEGVTNIGNSAFHDCHGLTKVVIPTSVTDIGTYAFRDCWCLTSVTIPAGVTRIGSWAFNSCRGLISVTISEGVRKIESQAFSDCSGLTFVAIPSSVAEIASSAFSNCSKAMNITVADGNTSFCSSDGILYNKSMSTLIQCPGGKSGSVTIPSSVTAIVNSAFYGCGGLTSVTIPEGVTNIADWTFNECSGLTSVTIPPSVTVIGARAFGKCYGLASVTIPEGVTKIANTAFDGCGGLTSVTIPSSVTVIGVGPFADCDKLMDINVADGNASFCSSDGILYNTTMSTLVQCPGGKSGSVMIPENVVVIGGYAFCGCDGLTSVTIPSSVMDIGAFAFSSCNGLKTVYVEKGDEQRVKGLIESSGHSTSGLTFAEIVDQDGTYTETVDGVEWTYVVKGGKASVGGGTSGNTAVAKTTAGALMIPTMLGGCQVTSVGEYAFYSCSGLTAVVIQSGVTSIERDAFYDCSGLTGVTIPESVESIGFDAFFGCSGLKKMVIPSGVTNISGGAFSRCYGLMGFHVGAGNEMYVSAEGMLFNKDKSELICCPAGCAGTVTIPSSVTSIGSYAFSTCSGLTSMTIPPSVTNVGSFAFSQCHGLREVEIPTSVLDIGVQAFAWCYGLTSVKIPMGVTSVGRAAFYLCYCLTEVVIPSSVRKIDSWSFDGCSSLNTVYVDHGDIERVRGLLADSGFSRAGVAFVEVTHAVTFDLGACGMRTGGGELAQMITNRCAAVAPEVAADAGWRFVGWDTDFSCVTNDLKVTAQYAQAVKPDGTYTETVDGIEWTYVVTNGQVIIGGNTFSSTAVPTTTAGMIAIPSTLGGCPVVGIGDYAFEGCLRLTAVTIPAGVISIGKKAFYSCQKLTTMAIPAGVESIGDGAFGCCYGLTTVTIPAGVTNIGNDAFYSCHKLTSVTIPASVTSFGSATLTCCYGLEEIVVDEGNAAYCSVDGMLLTKDRRELICYPAKKRGSVTIPQGVLRIDDHAFDCCTGLTSVVIPSSVTKIGTAAFKDCAGLKSVTVPEGVTDVGFAVFRGCTGLESVTVPEGVMNIDVEAFRSCCSLKSVKIPSSVTNIGSQAFIYCSGLESVAIPPNVTCIGSGAFMYCSGLKSVTIPSSVKAIESRAFTDCPNLTTVYVSAGDAERVAALYPFGELVQFVELGTDPSIYMVIDLSAGADALSYPVFYLDDIPPCGWTDEYKTTKLVLRRILNGSFTMGSPTNEIGRSASYPEGQHQVIISKPFYMGVFEMTQKQYELVMGSNPSSYKGDARPVESVSYDMIRGSSDGAKWPWENTVDETSFIGLIRTKTGLTFDLPTEAQWEYACRAGTTTALNSGKNLTSLFGDANMAEVGRYAYNSGDSSTCDGKGNTSYAHAEVGAYLPNAWGLYDLHGNVWEWCLDWLMTRLDASVTTDPKGDASGSLRVLRGGSWFNFPPDCRSAYRGVNFPSDESNISGFRLCCPAGEATDQVTVTFDANGGSGTMEPVETGVGGSFVIPKVAFTRTGYAFQGWATNAVGEVVYADEETIPSMSADLALFAKWEAIIPVASEYLLEITKPANGRITDVRQGEYKTGSTLTLEATPFPHSRFVGWTGDTEGCVTSNNVLFVTMDRPRRISASFALVEDEIKWYVDGTNGSDEQDGRSLATAFASIQKAIDVAGKGDVVAVAAGCYEPISITNVAVDVVSIDGAAKTVIDASSGWANGVSNRCATLGKENGSVTNLLQGFTLCNGRALYGAGAYCGRLVDCVVTNNVAGYETSGIRGGYGGGAYRSTLQFCQVVKNRAIGFVGYGGGGYGCRFENCTISGNSVSYYGGGGCQCDIVNCDLRENWGAFGGSAFDGCCIDNSVLTSNLSEAGGAAFSGCTLNNSVLVGNRGMSGSEAFSGCTLNNSLLVDNVAESGRTLGGGCLFNNCILIGWRGTDYDPSYSEFHACFSDDDRIMGTGMLYGDAADVFVNAEDGDYRLKPGASCIDAGVTLLALQAGLGTDISGANRYMGKSVDIGPYEFEDVELNLNRPSKTWYVDSKNGDDANDGTELAALGSIQKAVDSSLDGDRILVKPGIYGPIATYGLSIEIAAVEGADSAIIDGRGKERCANLGDGTNSCLIGFILKNGRGDLSDAWYYALEGTGCGGGCLGGTLKRCTLVNNKATVGGGAYRSTLVDCVVENNEAYFADDGHNPEPYIRIWNDDGEPSSERMIYYGSGGGACDCSLIRCRVQGNRASFDGGGALGGALQDCVVWRNSAVERGGGVCDAEVANCTVFGNRASRVGGGFALCDAKNCIVWNNVAANNPALPYGNAWWGTMTYSCCYPKPDGDGNIGDCPLFVDGANGDFRLAVNSPCVNAGMTYNVSAVDYAGNPRRVGCIDMGAYEMPAENTLMPVTYAVTLKLGEHGSFTPGRSAETVVTVPNGGAVSVPRFDRESGWCATGWDADIFCVNSNMTASAKWLCLDSLPPTPTGHGDLYYVDAAHGDDRNSGASWTNAFATLKMVAAMVRGSAGVVVADGVYAPFDMSIHDHEASVVMWSVNGAKHTIIDASLDWALGVTNGCVNLVSRGSGGGSIDGFTLRNGDGTGKGLAGGLDYGTAYNCIFSNCGGGWGAAYMASLYNCLFDGNASRIGFQCTMVNCTIVNCKSSDYARQSTLRNCILFGNTRGEVGAYCYDCFTDDTSLTGTRISYGDPLFVDPENGDYRLQENSPCIDAGTNLTSLTETDLDGNARISNGIVDIGAYEYQVEVVPVVHTVTFDANGGSGTMEPVTAEAGCSFVIPKATFTRTGYAFQGWATNAVGEVVYADEETIPSMSADLALFAMWEAIPPTYGPWGEADAVKNPDKLGPTMLTDMTLTINGEAGAIGDVVAAFRTDTGALCGLGKVLDDSGTLSMVCYAPAGAKLHFKVWIAASGTDEPLVMDCGARSDLAAPAIGTFLSGHALVANNDRDLTISLGSADWHTVSFNVLPDDPSPAAVFAEVQGKVAAVTQGIEFWMPGKASSLKAIEIGKGYWVNTQADNVEWTVSGKTDPTVEIALEEGWNLVGYAPETAGAVQQVLKTALAADAIDYVTYGIEFYPGGTLKEMEPGKAYWVHAKKAYVLQYDEVLPSKNWQKNSVCLQNVAVPTYGPWGESETVKNPDRLGPTMLTDMAVSIDGEPAASGDVVAVFRGDTGALCGLGKVLDDSGSLTLVCYAPKDVVLSFKVWLAASGVDDAVVATCDDDSDLVAPESGAIYGGHSISGSATGEPPEPLSVHFDSVSVSAEKGGAFELVVCGGSDVGATSVKVAVAYGSAKAADLVLKNATVSGADGVEKTNLTFPLTLSWAAGDIEPKTIVIPVAAGKATDAPKFLTWNLTDAQGLELGETACCIGRIAAGEKWSGEDVYVMPTVADAAGGKVSGGAGVKPDKKGAYKAVTLKATANKGYWFAGWYGADGKPASGDLSFKVTPKGGEDLEAYEARFVPAQPSLSGTYGGYARVNLRGMTVVKGADTSADVYGDYPVTVTLSAAGKVSGSITVGGKKVSFKTDCCDKLFIGSDGTSWAGFRATLNEKAWFGVDNFEDVEVYVSNRGSVSSRLEGLEVEGEYAPLGSDDSECRMWCDRSKEPAVKAKLKTLAGTYAAYAADGEGHVIPLSVVVDSAGKAKVAGKFYDGTALSASVVLGGYEEDTDGTDLAEWWTYGEAFLPVKSLGGGNLHLQLCGSLGDDEVEPTLSLSDLRVTSYSADLVAADPVSLDDRTWTLSRFDATAWFPPDADPDFGVVCLTSGGDVIDILYASKNGKITGLGKATSKDYAVKFDTKTGLLTVTKGKDYTIQGVLGDFEDGCYRAGRIDKDGTCEHVEIDFTTLSTPEEDFPWTDDGFELTLGQVFGEEMQPSVLSDDRPLELTVTGLPAGLKYDKKTGLITGAPTKAGEFKVKVGYSYGTRKITRETVFVVAPMPEGLPVGTYAGYATVYVDGTNEGQRVDCPFAATIDKNGALSGSITLFGKRATFKASGYDSGSAGSSVYTATLDLKPVDKTWGTTMFRLDVSSNDVYVFADELFGNRYRIWSVTARRDQTKDANRTARVAPYVGTYVAALDTYGGWFDEDSSGVSVMSVAVDKKGTAKLAGTFADGTAFTASAPLAVFEDEDGSWAYVDVVAVPKSLVQGGMCISLAFSAQEDAASGAKKVALECGVSASKYVRASGDFAEFGLYQNFAYRYSSLAWVDMSLSPMETCLWVRCDNESFADATFAWKTKTVAGEKQISGVGSRLSGPSMTFKIDDKTGLFSGTCGSYKIFGAMSEGSCSGIGTAVGKDGSVDWVWVEVSEPPLNP